MSISSTPTMPNNMKKQTTPTSGIYIRKSANPLKKTSYAVYFRQGNSYIGRFITDNGNIVDLGHIINNFLNHESVPMGMEKYEQKVEVNPKDDVPGVQPENHQGDVPAAMSLSGMPSVKETGDSTWINFQQAFEMLTKNTGSQMEWKPVFETIDESKYTSHTLVKVAGWNARLGFAVHYHYGWSLDPDCAEPASKKQATITHWLAIPKTFLNEQ